MFRAFPSRCRSFRSLLLASGLALTTNLPAEVAPVLLPRIEYISITSGLDYAHLRTTDQPWSIHIARKDRRQKNLTVTCTLGRDHIQGLAGVSKQASALPPHFGRPLAAINGAFFLIQPGPYQGDPEGLQILNGELVSAPLDRCFWVDTAGKFHLGIVKPRLEVIWPAGARTPMALNQTPPMNRATLFTATFGHATEATNLTELVLERSGSCEWLPLRVGRTYSARIREVRPQGNTTLSPDRLVLALSGFAKTNSTALKPGDVLKLATTTTPDIANTTMAIGGGPILVAKGKEMPWPAKTRAVDHLQPRHPRTALGFNSRYLYLVAVDGRQKELSIGMSFVELASLMRQIGCTEALNLDGGGSTTFWLDGKIMNSPSDKRERSVANAVVIVQKPK